MKSPYLLISLIFFTSFAYLLTWGFARLYIIKKSLHQKIWNILLLLTFMLAGVLGLLLAAQVNYKWEIPDIDKLLNWHVNFGIAMAVISIYHFIWHWNYYVHIFKREKENNSQKTYQSKSLVANNELYGQKLSIPLILLGFSSIISQLVLIREFLAVLSGNELVIGIILANWMIITGLGAYAGKRSKRLINAPKFINGIIIAIPFISILLVVAINGLKNMVFIPGSIIGIHQVFISSFVLLFPLCFLSGYLFTLLAFHNSTKGQNRIDKSYGIEALGSLFGGVLFNFILVYFLHAIQILAIVFIINASLVFFRLSRDEISTTKKIFRYFFLLLGIILIFSGVDTYLKRILYRNQEIVINKDTPYGNLVVTKNAEQYSFFENASLYFTTQNVVENEEGVHYAMLQKKHVDKVLLISGGVKGMVNEILKYPVKNIDYVEVNPWIIRIGKQFNPSVLHEKVEVHTKDPVRFLRKNNRVYDIIIMDLPGPVNANMNRLYTKEFFHDLHRVLSPDGIVASKMPSTFNYIGGEAAKIQSLIYHTLKTSFHHVRIVPGEQNYFLASNGDISLDFTTMLKEQNIENEYINKYYLDDYSIKQRSRYIESNLDETPRINAAYKPIAYYSYVAYWLSFFRINYQIWAMIAVVAVVLLLIAIKPIYLGLFSVGFTAASLEFVILFAFQVVFGYVFQMLGIIIMFFMLGLAAGAYFSDRIIRHFKVQSFIRYQLVLVGSGIVFLLILAGLQIINLWPPIIHFLFIVFTIWFSLLTGLLFSIATRINEDSVINTSAKSYGIDLIGSAIGILVTSIFLVPLIGMLQTILFLSLFNLLVVVVIRFRAKQYFL